MFNPYGSTDHPVCSYCRQEEIYDQTGRHPTAVVRVQFLQAPYTAKLCSRHLSQLQHAKPAGSVRIVERYPQTGP